MSKPTFISLFSGAGGFDLGFQRAGLRCVAQVEIDPNCQKLLRRKFPHALQHGDITTYKPTVSTDVVCGGSPCQDLSVGGLHAGLAGKRSGLFHQMVRVCKRVRPRFVVWENVDGAFGSNGGRDFAAILRSFTGVQVEVPKDGWGRAGFIKTAFPAWRWNVAWRVFDAQYFRVPQRRRRVFIVGSLGDGSSGEILFEPESLQGDSPPSREKADQVTGTLSARIEGGGGLGTDFECRGGLIAHSLRAEGFDASEDGSGRGTPLIATRSRNESTSNTLLPCGFNPQASGKQTTLGYSENITSALSVGQLPGIMGEAIRRLTPKECERLMSWPDDHTAGFSNSVRYRMCGNGVVSNVAEWIGRRIARVIP